MKRKIVNLLMLTLILTTMLNIAVLVKPSSAENSENNIFSNDIMQNTSQTTLPSEATRQSQIFGGFDNDWRRIFEKPGVVQGKTLESPSQAARSGVNKWDFHDTSGWSELAYVEGNNTRLIVGVNGEKPSNLIELERIEAKHQAKTVNTVSFGGKVRAIVVELLLASVESFVEELRAVGLASYIEPDMKVQVQFEPNDPHWDLQWGPKKIEANWAWNATMGNPTVLVAVVDTGVAYTHPDLAANYVPGGYDWVNMDSDPIDDFGHGTHVAGIIAAVINNSVGIAGLAQVGFMAEKVLNDFGSGYYDWVANGIVHAADQGANIISMSLGGSGDSDLVHDAVRYAYDMGVLVIAAAGNSNSNMKFYPAAYDEVVAVAATDQYDHKADFSNWGDWIELAAPGVQIYSTMPTYHVTLNDYGYLMDYDYLSGTSMACPHVSGVAALAWSMFPSKSRDWVSLWLLYTADDLGDPGFDVYYGYGRLNARKAVAQTPPLHELIAHDWRTPPYVEPGAIGIVSATVLNFGESDETDVTVQLLANDTLAASATIGFIGSGTSASVDLAWNPMLEGIYNLTLYVVPVPDEINLENNALNKRITVGFPLKAVVLHSSGNIDAATITSWEALNNEWYLFGRTMIYIDYTSLNKDDITYNDIAATEADVLIISCAYDPYAGWEFTDSEIEAIKQYVHEGHGLIATAGTLYSWVPNNNKLAPLFGLNETTMWSETGTDLLHVLNTTHPLFANVPNPLVFPAVGTAIPYDGLWDSNELAGGKYLAVGHYKESAIVTYKGLVFISPWLEVIPPYYRHPLQLLYNAITWSRYEKPEHELVASLEAPEFLQPFESTLLNATVSNKGLKNETDIELQLWINSVQVADETIPELLTGSSYTLSFPWAPTVEGTYNITAYAPPVTNEEFITNNKATIIATVAYPLIHPVEGQYANYTMYYLDPNTGLEIYGGELNFTYLRYVSPYQMNITMWMKDVINHYARNAWMIVNIFTKMVERDSGIGWVGMWFPGWIETDVTIGSTVNLLWGSATVLDSRVVLINGLPIDCWQLEQDSYGYRYIFWYDKASGLWIGLGMSMAGAVSYTYLLLAATNVSIGFKYEHDLAVALDAPTRLSPGTSTMLNATVYNTGRSHESNVKLQLTINDSIVASKEIPELTSGAFDTLSYLWAPPLEGRYNVTVYALPVSGEDYVESNVRVEMVTVRTITVALISSYSQLLSITGILDSMGINYDIYNNNDLFLYTVDFSLLKRYKVVVFYKEYKPIAIEEQTALNAYLSSGGNLIVTGFDSLVSDVRLADVVRSRSIGDNLGQPDLFVVNASHPIMNGPYGSFPLGYQITNLYSDCDAAIADTARNAQSVAKLANWYDKIIATGGLPGRVVFWNGRGDYDWIWNAESQAMLKNTLYWMHTLRDVAIVDVESSSSEASIGDSVDVTVVAENQGEVTENFAVTAYAFSLNSTKVYLDPPQFLFSTDTVHLGYRFNVTAKVHDVKDLFAYQVGLSVDDAMLNITGAWLPTWDPQWVFFGKQTLAPPPAFHDLDRDRFVENVWIGDVLFTTEPTFTGDGLLAIIEFGITALPPPGETLSCNLTIDNVDTYLLDSNLDSIPCTKQNGYYALSAGGTPPPPPPPAFYIIGTTIVTDLAPGERITLTFPWDTSDVFPRDYKISAQASMVPGETDIADNVYTNGVIKIIQPFVHDVAAIAVTPSTHITYTGRTISVNVTVANEGETPEDFTVTLYCNITVGDLVGTQIVENMLPGENRTLTFSWNTAGVIPGNYMVTAVASNVVWEIDIADNTKSCTDPVKVNLFGDATGDGKIDIKDIAQAALAFGSFPGHPRWNPQADLDQDGRVYIKDLAIVAKNFGKKI